MLPKEKKYSIEKLPPFGLANLFGWGLFIVLDSVIVTIWMRFDGSWYEYLRNTLQWFAGYFVTFGMRLIYRRVYNGNQSILKKIFTVVTVSLFAAAILFLLANLIYYFMSPLDISGLAGILLSTENIVFRMTQLFPIMVAWSMLYFGIKLLFDATITREKLQRAEFLAQNAQLQMLRYQVNPHFLFNSFSSLRALIRKDPPAAVEMVGELSEFYRYSLATKSDSTVELRKELEAIKHYAEIEKIRFDDKIDFKFNVSSEALGFHVPTFIIQPVVENAIKYGMKTTELPLRLLFNIEIMEGTLRIMISNSGKWVDNNKNREDEGTNTGLENIKNRLELLYPNRHRFETSQADGLVSVTIEIEENKHEEN